MADTKMFYGCQAGTEEADDALFALQVMYGHPEWGFAEFESMHLPEEEVEYAKAHVAEIDASKFDYFS